MTVRECIEWFMGQPIPSPIVNTLTKFPMNANVVFVGGQPNNPNGLNYANRLRLTTDRKTLYAE